MAELVETVALTPRTGAWFTTGAVGNLAHRRPHVPGELARRRRVVADEIGVSTDALHWMEQRHGADVGVVDRLTAWGAEVRGVDVLVTGEQQRALCVQVADCVPVLLGVDGGPVAAVHAGRRGIEAGVVESALAGLRRLGARTDACVAAIGPSIGPCCYEVPDEMATAFARRTTSTVSRTTWGTTSVDLRAAVRSALLDAGVSIVSESEVCTHCDPERRWFSHRADPAAGRQIGIVMIRDAA